MVFVEFKHCKKCNKETKHRFVKENRPNRSSYYSCAICSDNANKKHRINYWYRYIAQKANGRKREGSIKLSESHILALAGKQEDKCALSNVKFDIESKWFKPSIDRIDSTKGYTLDNIRLVTWIVNHCRGKLTDEEFVAMCKAVASK